MSYSPRTKKVDLSRVKKCELESGKLIYFYIRGNGSEMTISYHYEKEEKFRFCQNFDIRETNMDLVYLNFFARSHNSAPFLANVKSIVYSSDTENIGISEFEAKVDDNATKLFKQISYFVLNDEFLKSQQPKLADEEVNIKRLHESQTKVLSILDYTNILLDKNLEEGDEMLDFLGDQRGSIDDFSNSLLDSLNSWMTGTTQQFETMEKDALGLLTEYQNFDLEAEFDKTKTLMGDLSGKLGSSWQTLQNFRRFSDQIRPNIDYLAKKKKYLENFPELMEKYIQGNFSVQNSGYGTTVLIMFIGLGVVVIIALLAILKRLGGAQKKSSFEM